MVLVFTEKVMELVDMVLGCRMHLHLVLEMFLLVGKTD
jgi:hypothetical protein